jgi:hypothetical protein
MRFVFIPQKSNLNSKHLLLAEFNARLQRVQNEAF